MKAILSVFALGIAIAFTGPAFAVAISKATTEADCVKAGRVWNVQGSECAQKSAKMGKLGGPPDTHKIN